MDCLLGGKLESFFFSASYWSEVYWTSKYVLMTMLAADAWNDLAELMDERYGVVDGLDDGSLV